MATSDESVMQRLARMLKEANAPRCPRTLLTEALMAGDFSVLFADEDADGNEFGGD